MKRFANSIKLMNVRDFIMSYICFCFSLLANLTDIELAGEYNRAICGIFLTPYETKQILVSQSKIKAAVLERPENMDKLQNIIKKYNLNPAT